MDSPHHLGTCGLQARDFELLGFGDVDVIVTTGLSEEESPRARFALAPTVDVAPSELAVHVGLVRATSRPDNLLYARLAASRSRGTHRRRSPCIPLARSPTSARCSRPAGC